TLKDALKGSDAAFRVQVAKALVQIHPKDRDALSRLIDSLKGNDDEVRFEAMRILGDIGPDAREAIPALEVILKEEDERIYAAYAILGIQRTHRAALAVVIEDLKGDGAKTHLSSALARLGPEGREAAPALIALLKSEDRFVRDPAVMVLGRIGPAAKDAVPALINALKNQKSIWIVQTLGEIGSSEAVPALSELLK